MTILNLEGIEPFRDLRISDLELASNSGIGKITLERLKLKEEELTERECGLPFYLALQHHIKWRTVKDLGKELGVSINSLVNVFWYYEIPTLNRSETKRRYLKEHGDPKTKSRRIRKKQDELNNYGFPITDQERKKIIGAYGQIYNKTNFHGDWRKSNWRELINPVSEKTGIELKVVTSCLEDLFKKRY